MNQPSFNAIYQNAPHNRVDKLLQFRSTYPIQYHSIDNVKWSYILAGHGTRTILILGGITSTVETAHDRMLELVASYRVLLISYPLYSKMDTFIDGLVKLLDLENIDRVDLIGGSFGAGVGHLLIRRYPNRVGKLILSAFGLYSQRHLQPIKWATRLYQFLPYSWLTKFYKGVIPKVLKDVDEEERLFLSAYMQDTLDLQLNKQMLISQLKMFIDLFENFERYEIHTTIMGSNILIFQAEDDTSFDRDEQAALRQTYPEATIYRFQSGGHAMGKNKPEYDRILYQFLNLTNRSS